MLTETNHLLHCALSCASILISVVTGPKLDLGHSSVQAQLGVIAGTLSNLGISPTQRPAMHLVMLAPSGSTGSLLQQQQPRQLQHPSNRSSSTASGKKASSTSSATAAADTAADDLEQRQLQLLPSQLLQDLQARADVHVTAMPSLSNKPDGAKLKNNKASGAKTSLSSDKHGGIVKAAGPLPAPPQVPLTIPAAGVRSGAAAAVHPQAAGDVETCSGGSVLPMRELLDLALTRLRQSQRRRGEAHGRAEEEASLILPSSRSRLPPLLLLRACVQRSAAGGGCTTTTYSEIEADAEALLIEGAVDESFQEYRKRWGMGDVHALLPSGSAQRYRAASPPSAFALLPSPPLRPVPPRISL